VRRLIINADDFGLTPGVNRAIAEAHSRGVVTSTTLMANSRAFDQAVTLTHAMPNLGVGCHVVLVDGEPVLPPERVPTLARSSHFPASLGAVASATVRGKIRSDQAEEEVTAQIRKLQGAGVTVTHVDSHKHVHMLPLMGKAIVAAARACGVRAVRNPFVPVKPLEYAHLARRPYLWKRFTQTKLLRRYESKFRDLVAKAGMVTTDGSFGVVSTGALDAELFRAIIGSIPDGTWELVCHPGYIDDDLGRIRTRLRESRVKELEVLTSEEARRILSQAGIELISFAQLAANR